MALNRRFFLEMGFFPDVSVRIGSFSGQYGYWDTSGPPVFFFGPRFSKIRDSVPLR